MRKAILIAGLVVMASTFGCGVGVEPEQEGEQDQRVQTAAELTTTQPGGNGYTCSSTMCTCVPGAGGLKTCIGFETSCQAAGWTVTCCRRWANATECTSGYNHFADTCHCNAVVAR